MTGYSQQERKCSGIGWRGRCGFGRQLYCCIIADEMRLQRRCLKSPIQPSGFDCV